MSKISAASGNKLHTTTAKLLPAMEITLETISSQLVTTAGRCGTTQCDNNNKICVTKISKLLGLLNSYKPHATLLSFLYFLFPAIWTPLQTSLVLIHGFTHGELFSRPHKITQNSLCPAEKKGTGGLSHRCSFLLHLCLVSSKACC